MLGCRTQCGICHRALACCPARSDEPLARQQQLVLSDQLYAVSRAVHSREFMNMNPLIRGRA
jgi:hypothetical protein